MLDEEAATRSFDEFYRLWVEPELRRRFGEAGPPSNFRIFQCLVRLPDGPPAIVEFNDEVSWATTCKIPNGTRVEKGDAAYLHQIEYVESVGPPECDGKPVGFVYIHRVPGTTGFRMMWAGSPALAQADPNAQDSKWEFSDAVCEYLTARLSEKAIQFCDEQQQALASIGIWPIPSLIPYPLSFCTHLVQNGKHDEARAALVRHCSPDWLEAQLNRWLTVPELAERRELLSQALAAHRATQYILTIHALLPQFEGVVSDRMMHSLRPGSMKFGLHKKLAQLKDRALEDDEMAFSFRRVIELTMDFVLKGPVLERFNDWLDDPNCMFPPRHFLAHGKFIEELYTEENSVKAFLLLDTLAEILKKMGSAATPSQGS